MTDAINSDQTDKDILRQVSIEIHSDNPREGPGDAESTKKAFALIKDLPARPHILDIGCGPGMQTIELARLAKGGEITALDCNQHYLDEIKFRAVKAGISDRIRAEAGSMFKLRFKKETFDLIWAESSIYIIGLEKGLREWRPLLKKNGYIAFTHLSWLTKTPPAEPKEFWARNYPEMATIEDDLQTANSSGFEVIGYFTLPESAWWNDYYTPIEKRLITFRTKYKNNEKALRRIEETQQEIDLYRRYSNQYGYVFYILRNKA